MNAFVMTLLLLVGLSYFVYVMYGRASVLLAMKPTNRLDRIPERVKRLVLFGLGQKRMVNPEEAGPGFMHVLIYAAFMVLALRELLLVGMGFSETLLAVLSTPT